MTRKEVQAKLREAAALIDIDKNRAETLSKVFERIEKEKSKH